LNAKGYEAYFSGRCIRDKLMGKTPQDFEMSMLTPVYYLAVLVAFVATAD